MTNFDLEKEMYMNDTINFKKQEVKFEKAYVTMVCNPKYNNNEVRLWLYLQLNESITNGGAFPSKKKITADTGMSASTIIRTIKTLEEKNALITIQRFLKGERRQIQNLVMLNAFNEQTGEFENGEAWKYVTTKYNNRMAYVVKKEIDGKVYYNVEPIPDSEIIENSKGIKTLKALEEGEVSA